MITRGIRELVARDWNAARVNKDAYWGDRIGSLGPFEGLRIADELRRQVQAQDSGWPHPDQRQEDLDGHIRLAALFRRAGTPSRR